MKKQLINLEPVKEQVRNKLLEKYNSTVYMNTDEVAIKVDIKEILEEYIEQKQLTEPTIYITTEAFAKMRKLVDDTSTEIGWYGTVTKMPQLDEIYIIEDIIIYPQKVTGATCEQDEDKMFEFEMSLTNEQVNMKRFHGHSHVNMGVTPSGVDENFYQDILTQVNDYFIIAITNKRNEYTVRFYDVQNNILYTDIPLQPILNNGISLDRWYKEQAKQLTQPVYTTTTTTKSYTALDQAKQYDYKKQYNLFDDEVVWDERFGYVDRQEQDWLNGKLAAVGKGRRGRPKKRR